MELYQGGHYDDALVSLKKALVIQPDFPDAYFLIARIYDDMNRPQDALTMYERVIEYLPNDQEARWAYGKSLIKAGEETKGVKILTRGLKSNPRDHRMRIELIRYYMRQQKYRKALSLAEKGIRLTPEYAPHYALCGDILRKQKKLYKAQDYYERGLEIDPEYEPAKRGLNSVIHAMEKQNRESSNLGSPEEEAREELVEAASFYKLKDYDTAIVRLLDLKENPYVGKQATILLGMALSRKGLHKRAYDVFLETTNKQEPDIMVLYHLGLAANRMGRFETAIDFLRKALERDDEYEEALIEMGIACFHTHHLSEARNFYVRALKVNRETPRPYALLALLAYRRNDKKKVAEFLGQATRLDANSPEIAFVKGYMAVLEEKYEIGIKNLQRCLEHSPDHFEALKMLGKAYLEFNDSEKALEAYRSASALNPADAECANILEDLSTQITS